MHEDPEVSSVTVYMHGKGVEAQNLKEKYGYSHLYRSPVLMNQNEYPRESKKRRTEHFPPSTTSTSDFRRLSGASQKPENEQYFFGADVPTVAQSSHL